MTLQILYLVSGTYSIIEKVFREKRFGKSKGGDKYDKAWRNAG